MCRRLIVFDRRIWTGIEVIRRTETVHGCSIPKESAQGLVMRQKGMVLSIGWKAIDFKSFSRGHMLKVGDLRGSRTCHLPLTIFWDGTHMYFRRSVLGIDMWSTIRKFDDREEKSRVETAVGFYTSVGEHEPHVRTRKQNSKSLDARALGFQKTLNKTWLDERWIGRDEAIGDGNFLFWRTTSTYGVEVMILKSTCSSILEDEERKKSCLSSGNI